MTVRISPKFSLAGAFARLFKVTSRHGAQPSYGYAPATQAQIDAWNAVRVSRQQRRRDAHKRTKALIKSLARKKRMYA